MGEITISTIVLILAFVTPALPILFAFRLAFPRARTIGPSELLLFVLSISVSAVINWPLFMLIGDQFARTYLTSSALNAHASSYDWHRELVQALFVGEPPIRPLRLAHWFSSFFTKTPPADTNAFLVFLDLQITPTVYGLLILGLKLGGTALFEKWECHQYTKAKAESESRYKNEAPGPTRIHKALRFFQEAFYHPWTILTLTNQKRELLMVDVLTTEGSLYSGKLTSWIPDENTISAVSMYYPLRYIFPSTPKKEKHAASNPWFSSDVSKETRAQGELSVGTSKRLIPNNGEMVIPAEKIETIHFWELRKGRKHALVVKDIQDVDVVKWYLLLAFTHPGFIESIHILLRPTADEALVRKELARWGEEYSITFETNKPSIKMYTDKAGQSSAT